MNRRHFIRGMALATVVAAGGAATTPDRARAADGRQAGSPAHARAPLAPLLTADGRLLQGTADGKVLESADGGGSWHKIADFGPHCAVARLAQRPDGFVATIAVQGHTFAVRSADGRLWRTTGAVRPAA